MNDETLYVVSMEKCGKNKIVPYKIVYDDKKDMGYGTSGVPLLRFISWIKINLCLVTKRS